MLYFAVVNMGGFYYFFKKKMNNYHNLNYFEQSTLVNQKLSMHKDAFDCTAKLLDKIHPWRELKIHGYKNEIEQYKKDMNVFLYGTDPFAFDIYSEVLKNLEYLHETNNESHGNNSEREAAKNYLESLKQDLRNKFHKGINDIICKPAFG